MPSNDTENIYSTQFNEGKAQPIPATRIGYDNTTSGLDATDVQTAIDETAEKLNGTVLQNGFYQTITYTPSSDESWQSRLYHLSQELQAYQNALEDNERFTITNLNLGTTSLWALHANSYYKKTSIIGDDFMSILVQSTQMSFRSVRFEPTEANNRFGKTQILFTDNSVICTDETATVGTQPVSLRIVKYKVNE